MTTILLNYISFRKIPQKRVNKDLLYGKYGIQPLCPRYQEHTSCFMHRQSKRVDIIDFVRPPMNFRSNKSG